MSFKSTALFFGAGIYLSQYLSKRQKRCPVLASGSGMLLLTYSGSVLEFDKLISEQEISVKRPGFWLIGGGIVCAGLSIGTIGQKISSKFSK